jgi:methanogenic corrinoid protein MtbC1
MVAVVCVPGDVHALGAELLAQYLEYQGWDVLFLGASMPEEDMLRLLEQQQPEALVISIRMIAFLPALRGLVQRVRERLPDMQIMAGGLPRAATVLNTICDGVPADFEACHHLLERRQRHA